jgi:aryl-phospho-beta-D-glucosidase BglC (GH1 family)
VGAQSNNNILSIGLSNYGTIIYAQAIPTPTATSTAIPTPTATSTAIPTPTATSTAIPTPTATSTPTSTPTFNGLHVDGTRLKDASGNVVVLRGVVYSTSQWWGDSPGQCTEQQFIYMKNIGVNFVSLNIQDYTFDYHTGRKTGCYNDVNFWSKLDNIIQWCENQGLYVN